MVFGSLLAFIVASPDNDDDDNIQLNDLTHFRPYQYMPVVSPNSLDSSEESDLYLSSEDDR